MSGKTEGDPYKLIVIIHCLETLVQVMCILNNCC